MEELKNKIAKLENPNAENILKDIMNVYLDKGFGLMNKTEIETLFYHVFRKHNLLSGKCFDDSYALQIPESKARKLIYESQVKYGTRDENERDANLRKKVGEYLLNANFVKNKGKDKNETVEIRFAIEDKYIRVALNAKLRENYYFADTSFNTDIISLDEEAFKQLVSSLVPNYQKDQVYNNFKKNVNNKKKVKELTGVSIDELINELIDELNNKDQRGDFINIIFQKLASKSIDIGLKFACRVALFALFV